MKTPLPRSGPPRPRSAIIGSGPAGAAAAHALTEAGHDVTVIDVGFEIEPELAPLAAARPPVDAAAFLAAVEERRRRGTDGRSAFPRKLAFGSDFVYRGLPETGIATEGRTHVELSLALGGLSNVWGANVSAVAERDVAGWPFPASALVPGYAALARMMDVSGTVDDIDRLYPAALAVGEHYPLGLHARRLLAETVRQGERLRAAGLHCGRAKIAAGPRYSVEGVGCTSCGLCMHGCPHRAIFNGADVIRALTGRPNFRYLPGRFVCRFAEDEDGVEVLCRPTDGGPAEALRFDRLLIAGGVLGSTAIVARSLDWCGREFVIRDSQKYYFPFVRYRRAAGALTERVNTLAQVFIQDVGLHATPRTVHCQLYGINDLFFEALAAKLGPLTGLARALGAPLFERMMIGMVYFHSDDSGALLYRVDPRDDRALGRVAPGPTPDTRPLFREFMGRLAGFASAFGGQPLPFLAEASPPGHSLHFGGSLPMTRDPGPGQTDPLGRPAGCRRVHVIDTSVLPSIPGTPTTYAIMANALRICAAVEAPAW